MLQTSMVLFWIMLLSNCKDRMASRNLYAAIVILVGISFYCNLLVMQMRSFRSSFSYKMLIINMIAVPF